MKKDVYQMIQEEFQNGSDEQQAYINICLKFKLYSPSRLTVGHWLKRLHDHDVSLKEEMRSMNYRMLCNIVGQYMKFTHAMFYQNNWKPGRNTIIQDRYIFSANDNTNSFTITDLFNKESRKLQTTMGKSNWSEVYFPTLINSERVLLNVARKDNEHLILLEVDFDKLKCLVLSEVALSFICFDVFVDSLDSSRFVLQDEDDNGRTIVYKGHMANDKIYVADRKTEFGAELFGCKLIGEKLCSLRRVQDDKKQWHYTEYDISSNSARKLNDFPLLECPEWLEEVDDSKGYVWEKNKMYTVYSFDEHFSIFVFDSDTLKWSNTKFIGVGRVNKLAVDEDHILTVSASEYSSKSPARNTIYRLPMQKPDKLRYFVWSKIRRGSLFFESDLYEKFSPCLPYNSEFRPFDEHE